NQQLTLASPTQLKLVANGSGLTLKDGNILIQCPKAAVFKASVKQQLGPQGASHAAPALPHGPFKGCEFKNADATQSGSAGVLR
ncbi:uncharacterized protein (DUF2345 family), partial [Chitinivorax tropicus]